MPLDTSALCKAQIAWCKKHAYKASLIAKHYICIQFLPYL